MNEKNGKSTYGEYKSSHLWLVIENALNELKKNQDITITTKEELVVGFLCKKILESNIKNKLEE